MKPKLKRGDKARFLCAAMACRRALELLKVTDLEIFGHVEETCAKQVEAAFAIPEGYFAECRTNMEWLDIHKKQQVKIRKKQGIIRKQECSGGSWGTRVTPKDAFSPHEAPWPYKD